MTFLERLPNRLQCLDRGRPGRKRGGRDAHAPNGDPPGSETANGRITVPCPGEPERSCHVLRHPTALANSPVASRWPTPDSGVRIGGQGLPRERNLVSRIRRNRRDRVWLAGGRRRGWLSALSWLSIVSILSLLFMPVPDGLAIGDDPGAAVAPCSTAAPAGPSPPGPAGHGEHGNCPFCVAHAGYTPPPPQPPALAVAPPPLPAPARPVAGPWTSTRFFLISPPSRAPPGDGRRPSAITRCSGAEGLCPV